MYRKKPDCLEIFLQKQASLDNTLTHFLFANTLFRQNNGVAEWFTALCLLHAARMVMGSNPANAYGHTIYKYIRIEKAYLLH